MEMRNIDALEAVPFQSAPRGMFFEFTDSSMSYKQTGQLISTIYLCAHQ
jgi:hypothetical protein